QQAEPNAPHRFGPVSGWNPATGMPWGMAGEEVPAGPTQAVTVSAVNNTVAQPVTNNVVAPITANNVPPPPLPSFAVGDVIRNEGDGTLTFTVTKTGATSLQSSVHFDTLAGTALAGVDFTATSGDLVFAPGETTKTVAVSLVNDAAVEPTESFSLKLSGSVSA